MAKPRLHLDADASSKALWQSLLQRGHDVSRTPNDWMPVDADDRTQLLRATASGRCIFTFNIRDFLVLNQRYRQHAGIVLSTQGWSLSQLTGALDRLLRETGADDWPGQLRWLNDWLKRV